MNAISQPIYDVIDEVCVSTDFNMYQECTYDQVGAPMEGVSFLLSAWYTQLLNS